MQNLSVLTRGNTLQATRCCCSAARTRTCRSSRSAGASASPRPGTSAATTTRRTSRSRSSIIVPENAQYYAAFGAVLYGLHEPADVGALRGTRPRSTSSSPRPQGAASARPPGPPLVEGRAASSTTFRELYTIPKFDAGDARAGPDGPRRHRPRRRLDVVEGRARRRRDGEHPREGVPALEGQPDPGHEGAPRAAQGVRRPTRARRSRCMGFGATGYAADVLEESRAEPT